MGCAHQQFNFLDGHDDASKADPLESRFTTVRHLSLVDQSDGLKHIGDVIEAPYFCLEQLFIVNFAIRDLLGSLLEREDVLPGHKESDELKAEVTERLHFLIFGLLLLSASIRLATTTLAQNWGRLFVTGPVFAA